MTNPNQSEARNDDAPALSGYAASGQAESHAKKLILAGRVRQLLSGNEVEMARAEMSIVPHFQRKDGTKTRIPHAAEALARMVNHNNPREIIPAPVIFAAIHGNRMRMVRLTSQMIDLSMARVHELVNASRDSHFRMWINIPPYLVNEATCNEVQSAMRKYDVHGRNIGLEITEEQPRPVTLLPFAPLRQSGVRIALDDVGKPIHGKPMETGEMAIDSVTKMAAVEGVDELKLDAAALSSRLLPSLVDHILRTLRKDVTIEGVSGEKQIAGLLRDSKVLQMNPLAGQTRHGDPALFQGYFHDNKPKDAKTFMNDLTRLRQTPAIQTL